jgi:hypothetical protein
MAHVVDGISIDIVFREHIECGVKIKIHEYMNNPKPEIIADTIVFKNLDYTCEHRDVLLHHKRMGGKINNNYFVTFLVRQV